jgi:hypothetical protein
MEPATTKSNSGHLTRNFGWKASISLQPELERALADFLFHANIEHYKERLAFETDGKTIEMLHKLLAEEEAKLREWQAKNPKPNAAE